MKMLTVSALVCAMMVLTGAAGFTITDSCPIHWFQFGGRWFHFVPQRMTWAEAEKNCQSLGGNLASIHSLQEYRLIQKVVGLSAWIGGSDAKREGQWFWTDGSTFNYRNWCHSQPDNGNGRQHCLQINYSAANCWDDLFCDSELPSVCVRAN